MKFLFKVNWKFQRQNTEHFRGGDFREIERKPVSRFAEISNFLANLFFRQEQ